MCNTLAAIHRVDINKYCLSDFGKHGQLLVWYPPLHIEEEGSGDICKRRSCKWNAIKAESTMYFTIFLCRNANRAYVITK